MKKPKLSFGEGGFKGLVLRHIEKVVAGLVLIGVAMLLYSGWSSEGLKSDMDPSKLSTLANEALTNVNLDSSKEILKGVQEVTDFVKRSEKSLEPTPDESYAFTRPLIPPDGPAQEKRRDPKLYPAEKVVAIPFRGGVAWKDKNNPADPFADVKNASRDGTDDATKRKKRDEKSKKKGRKGGPGMMAGGMSGPGGMGGGGGGGMMSGPAGMGGGGGGGGMMSGPGGMGGGGGMMSGMGGMGGGGGSMFGRSRAVVKYKLVRFFDFEAAPGKKYRYRVRLALEDPNNPLGSTPPEPRILEPDVLDRIGKAQARQAERETYWRDYLSNRGRRKVDEKVIKDYLKMDLSQRLTDWSEATAPVTLPANETVVAGPAVPAESRVLKLDNSRELRFTVTDPEGKMVPVVWDAEKAVYVPTESNVTLGTVLNLDTDCNVPHPLELALKLLEKYKVVTNSLVVDIRGGEPLDEMKDALTAPGEFAVIDSEGRLVVHDELDQIEDFRRYTYAEDEKPRSDTQTGGSPAAEGPGGMSPMGPGGGMSPMGPGGGMSPMGPGGGMGPMGPGGGKKGKR